jgi:hypothetical protein
MNGGGHHLNWRQLVKKNKKGAGKGKKGAPKKKVNAAILKA